MRGAQLSFHAGCLSPGTLARIEARGVALACLSCCTTRAMSALRYSRGTSKHDAYPEVREAPTFEAFERAVLADRAPAKGLQYIAAPFRTNGDGRAHRGKDEVEPRRFLPLDFDRIAGAESYADLRLWLSRFRGFGFTTASSTPEAPRCRVILELDRQVDRTEGMRLGAALMRAITRGIRRARKARPVRASGRAAVLWAGDRVGHVQARRRGARRGYCGLRSHPRSGRRNARALPSIDPDDDPVILKLKERGLYKRSIGSGRHAIECPWGEQHTTQDDANSTATIYIQPHYGGFVSPGFKCQHTHCEARKGDELLDFLEIDWRTVREAYNTERPKTEPAEPGATLLDVGFWAGTAKVNLNMPYVVKGVADRGQLVVVWGAPGSGKSFNMIELLMYVGSGVRWRGRRVKRGVVIYVCAESTRAHIENRIAALIRERPDLAAADVLVVPLALDLLHEKSGDVDRVIAAAKALAGERGEVLAIAIDTLAVTFGGGDENGPDMGRYVANVKWIIQETGAAVFVVHHSGKDEAKGMRGHSALLGALDAELAIEGGGDGPRLLRTGKVRDGDAFTDLFAFTLRTVELGHDRDGDPVRTCVIDSTDEAGTRRVREQRKRTDLGKNQKTVVQTLDKAGGRMARANLAHRLKNEGMPKNRVYEVMAALLGSGMLIAHNDCDPPEVSLS